MIVYYTTKIFFTQPFHHPENEFKAVIIGFLAFVMFVKS